MPLEVGSIEPVAIKKVWQTESTHFTPWLESHIGELDKVLGLGLNNPQREVGAGDFRIDLVAETNFGEVVIENQFGRTDHRHLGQLVTYLSQREIQRAIWIAEEARPEHVKAVETLNDRGLGQVWMVTVQAIRIGDSLPAPLFTGVAAPSEDAMEDEMADPDLTPAQRQKRDFMAALFAQAREEGIDSPFRDLAPNKNGLNHTPARGQGLLYRVAVNRQECRVVLTNSVGRWTGALKVLAASREKIDEAFSDADLPKTLEWDTTVAAGRWAILYRVDANYQGEVDPARLRELNHAAAAMKQVFDPHVRGLDSRLEADSE
ncbi:MAG: hypothetical protein OXN97_06290 [Bryobacterales bacterium]|nr:hypothetical protein [Bryobacterales bacterium]